jgi:hypothetical protein
MSGGGAGCRQLRSGGSSSILDLDFPDEHRADKRPLVEQTVSGE